MRRAKMVPNLEITTATRHKQEDKAKKKFDPVLIVITQASRFIGLFRPPLNKARPRKLYLISVLDSWTRSRLLLRCSPSKHCPFSIIAAPPGTLSPSAVSFPASPLPSPSPLTASASLFLLCLTLHLLCRHAASILRPMGKIANKAPTMTNVGARSLIMIDRCRCVRGGPKAQPE